MLVCLGIQEDSAFAPALHGGSSNMRLCQTISGRVASPARRALSRRDKNQEYMHNSCLFGAIRSTSLLKQHSAQARVTKDLIRLSVGIEHIEDLLEDIDQTLAKT